MVTSQGSRPALTTMLLLALLIVGVFLVSMNLGSIRLSPAEVFATLIGAGTKKQALILFNFRLPRIVLALLAGMGLAVSGAIMQGISRNGLADPGILGINAGAGLTVVALILFYPSPQAAEPMLLPLAALVGSMLAAMLIYTLAWKRGITTRRLLLVGIACGAGIGAVSSMLMLRMQFFTVMLAQIYLVGSVYGANWRFVLALLPWMVVLIPLAIYKARMLNTLNLGDPVAIGLGARVERERLLLLGTAAALAGACVAVAGGIGFLGLLGPHLGRRLVGPNHKVLIPTSALIGALLLLAADTVARNILAPTELPVGIVVSAIGAPYFLYLLTKTKA